MLMFKIAKVTCIFISTLICTAIFEDILATKQPITCITSLTYIFSCPLLLIEFNLDVAELCGQFLVLFL